MHTNAVLVSLITLAKLISSAPAGPTSIPSPVSTSTSSCIVSKDLLKTLDKPFTLTALTPGLIQWPVQLDPPSKTTQTQPYISRTKIAPALFRLTGGNLTTIGRGAGDSKENRENAFPAYFGPVIQIFPPVPDPIFFGAFQYATSGFQVGNNCGKDGKAYFELRAGGC